MKSSLPPLWQRFNPDHEEIEDEVGHEENSYRGLKSEALYTSDEDLESIFKSKSVSGTFCDLGCGTGRGPLIYGLLYPDRRAIGIEFESARLNPALVFRQENKIENVELIQGNLIHTQVPQADTYFLYFPTGPVLDKILTELLDLKHEFHLVVIESHGDLIPRIELENCFKLVEEVLLKSPRHYPYARVYKKLPLKRNPDLFPFTLSYQSFVLLIGEEEWIGETLGMTWMRDNEFDLKYPPRTIDWKDVRQILPMEELHTEYLASVKLRELGSLIIKTDSGSHEAFIRKILTRPTFALELSSGKTVEWKDIQLVYQGTKICYDSSWPSLS